MQECSPREACRGGRGKQIGSQAFRVLMAEKPDEDGYEPTGRGFYEKDGPLAQGQPVGSLPRRAGRHVLHAVAAHNAINGGGVLRRHRG
jgi:hypothetical protein